MATVQDMICKPFQVHGEEVSAACIARAVDMLANVPAAFAASDLNSVLPNHFDYQERHEALNRLMQRWRKLGLVSFKTGRWTLAKGAWAQMQAAAFAARTTPTKETPQ